MNNIKEMLQSELLVALEEEQKQLFRLRSTVWEAKERKPHLIRQGKKKIARIKTLLRERELRGVTQ